MVYVLTDAAGKINAGETNEVDLTIRARKRRTLPADASAKDRRWFTTYESADAALFLAPMHGRGLAPRLWQASATVAKEGDTLRRVTAELDNPAEVVGAAMALRRRIDIGLALAPWLEGHAGYAAWAERAAKADLDAISPDQQEHIACEAATWAHRAQWEAGQKGMAFDLPALIERAL